MTSWGGEDDVARADGDRTPGTADDGGGERGGAGGDSRSAGDAPPVITPDEIVPPGPRTAPVGLGLWGDPVPGDDPLPSTGSLTWAPDPTEPLAPDPTAAPSGDESTAAGRPVLPAYRDRARTHSRRRPPPPRPAGGPAPRRRTDPLALGATGLLVAIVAVAAVLTTRDGGGPDEPARPATTSTSPVAADGAEPAGPIVGPTGVIGSWSGSEWEPRADGEQPGAGLDYAVVGPTDRFGTARGEAVAEDCPDQRATSSMDVGVDLDRAGSGGGPPPIAVAGVAEPQPRTVEPFGTDAGVYRQAAAEVAAGLGATTPPTLTQVLRTDLDGGGTDEIVVAAEHVSAPAGRSAALGDWSVVFMRRVVGNEVVTDVLASSVVGRGGGLGGANGFDRIQVSALADLNGDGAMEVALVGRSEAGEWTSIQALDDHGVPSEVLRAGCEG